MAILDSCIGGKSSINVGATKNLIGNIYPPQSVRIDPAFTETLTPEMVVSGLAEGVKICFAGGAEAFNRFLELAPAGRGGGRGEASASPQGSALDAEERLKPSPRPS